MPLKIEHRIGIKVPAEVIWEILVDVSNWPQWSRIYPRTSGVIGFGESLVLTVALPEESEQIITPTVLDWTPNEAIHWRSTAVGGLITSVRYLEIERLHETGCVFSNGELFAGLLGSRLARRRRRSLREGFAAFGEALRARAEAAWRERAEGAT